MTALKNPKESGLEKFLGDLTEDDFNNQKSLWEAGIAEAKKLSQLKVSLLFKKESRFPRKLLAIPDCPEWLFVQGNIENLHVAAVAIVGTRKPSEDGIFLTKYLVAALTHQRCVTVSGLALGIDQTAHVESIRYGIPTVAVLGTGISENYPKGSETLRAEIIKAGGTVISEYLPNQSYSAENFVRRNRLQAALGDILFPTEWQIKSGTSHTVKFAHKYDKKIVNLHLPLSYSLKPELRFAEDSYQAISVEIPRDTQLLIGLVALISEDEPISLSEQPDHIFSAEESSGQSGIPEKDLEEEASELAPDVKNPQLSLL